VGGTNGAVKLWSLETRQCIGTHQIAGGEVQILKLKFSPKDTLLLANSGQVVDGDWKSTVTVLNLATGQSQSLFDDTVWAFGFSPGRKTSGRFNGRLQHRR
jgi:WD40 repeat protein